ncbi:NAD(P)H nitroreductase [Enterococcus thailandicus]|uniref:NAD(P)H nitroreductase n=1 Tax=Enterococcus thailandicus TaxID=417368 RepID=A0A249SIY9_ENTTH|nr:nitroreductase family protein [Enterococcus thailandicus]ASZ07501.1 nitroreductase family protein [Enterococcus thailandicus]MDA3965184.1 nitroreductase family protein [Enterococcus thailandicus]MDK4351162.1 nitroreductase family protein [Enterococcus thailandicus]MDT2733188.1 nitroreductase family protein [Enterococcus thailandicus]MDT2750814.1 nitroreductase family protein [Enterococcus thailandicus]
MKLEHLNDFNKIIAERKSIRKYDPEVKISKVEMTEMLKLASTAPSAANIQPWRVVVVESDEAKATLEPVLMGNKLQNETSSAMLLIFGDLLAYENVERIYDEAVEKQMMPLEVREQQVSTIRAGYSSLPTEVLREVVKTDASLFAMQLMLIARSYGYDTNPMTGFYQDQLAETFSLDPERYVPVMILSIGKAVEEGYRSIRLTVDEFSSWK